MPKRRVFISYHHKDEQSVVDDFVRTFSGLYDVFTDKSLERASDSENTEYLNQVCRDAIDGTSVTIVMIGQQTGCRKFVDWELRYTLHCNHGLVAISRPNFPDARACLPQRLVDNRNTGYAKWYQYPNDAATLYGMIEEACSASSSLIDNSRSKMKRNSSC